MGIQENITEPQNNLIEISKKIISLYIVALFSIVWISYYNLFAFRASRTIGGILSIGIYFIIYSYLAKIYKASKIGTYQIGEIVFSQILAIGLADIVLYIECCLIARGYVSIIPGLITAALQITGMILWAIWAKQYFIKHIKASNTLIIYGKDDVNEFVHKIERKYAHLFAISKCVSSDKSQEELIKEIEKCDTVMLYEIASGLRTETMKFCIEKRKNLYMTPRIADIMIQGFEKRTFIDTPLLKYEYSYLQAKTYHWKRLLDITTSVFCMLFFSVPMLIAAIAIKLEDGGPIFYKQKRCTKDGKEFNILKFRSMIVNAEKDGFAVPCVVQDTRITKVGKIIRRFRIDEMPQILNVLKGDMSIVGPRPERVEHVEEYSKQLPEFNYRLRVKGGLTGYAQIYGKYNTNPEDKLKLDMMYIENQSLLLDLKIIMLTLKIIFVPESTEGFAEEKSKMIGKWENRVEWNEVGKRI